MSVLVLQKAEDDSRQDGKDGVVAGGGGSGGGWRGGRAAVLVEPQSQQQARARGRPSLGDASELIATASTALRRLHFKSGTGFRRRTSSTPAPKVIVMGGSLESQNTSTDSSNTVITMVTVDDSCEQEHHHEEMRITPNLLEDMVGLGEDEAMHLEHTSLPHQVEEDDWQRIKQTASRGTVKRLKLLSKRYAKTNYDEDRPRHGRGSSGFAAEQMTIESEDSFSKNSPPVPDSPTTPVKPFQEEFTCPNMVATIVIQQASVCANSPEATTSSEGGGTGGEDDGGSDSGGGPPSLEELEEEEMQLIRRQENMKLLDVANTLTLEQLHEFEMKYGSPHHSRSQSVKPRSRPTYLSLPQARTRVASMPNTGAEEQYYRLRHFSITGKGVVNRGDSLRSRRSHSHNSVASTNSTNSTDQGQGGCPGASNSSSRQSSCVSFLAPYRVVMLGTTAVGKSSLISQFMTSEYLHAYDTSIDDEYGEKSVSVLLDGEESELIFIDHPCAEMSPTSCLATYTSSPHAYCVVYSTSDRQSFKVAEQCLQALWKADAIRTKAVILVANKTDLVRSRVVTAQDGKSMATSYDCKFIETSVGINHNVDELLVGILTQIRLKQQQQQKTKGSSREGEQLGVEAKPGGRQQGQESAGRSPLGGHQAILGGGGFPKLRGTRTSASLKVKGLLSKVWARDSKSKSCENLHVL